MKQSVPNGYAIEKTDAETASLSATSRATCCGSSRTTSGASHDASLRTLTPPPSPPPVRLRVRIVNKTTKRYKDMLVEQREDLNLYDAVYNNESVKDAHVRKWGNHIAKQVKNKTAEIQCVVETMSHALRTSPPSPVVLSIDDLKRTSTKQLSELAAAASIGASPNRIQLALECVTTPPKTPLKARPTSLPLRLYHTVSSDELETTSRNKTLGGRLSSSAPHMATSRRQSLPRMSNNATFSSTSTAPIGNTDRIQRFLTTTSIRNGLQVAPLPKKPETTSPSSPEKSVTDTESTPPAVGVLLKTNSTPSVGAGVSLPPHLVQEVFPYHLVFDENFQIIQVGNCLAKLLGDCTLVGKTVSDLLMFTGPMPMKGTWEWSTLERMKDKTVFLKSVHETSPAKIKGTIIEVSASPRRQVMLALFPDVKNLSELTSMNLSIADLPVHSCQRDAVLVGEHSASEVKLTHHLDQLHRDLINSMEKQIADRTVELADANRDLERANEKLAQHAARQLEHFACMSHEIRTPLNCIVGMTSVLLGAEHEMSPRHAEAVHMINGSGELLRAVVDDVLDYAKLESGSFETVVCSTDLQETLDIVVHSIAQKVKAKNITLRTHYSATLPNMMETDSRRLQQVLYNLLGNAGKFSAPDSPIDLTVSLIKSLAGGDRTDAQGTGDTIRFSVKDYGTGIRREDFKTIFKPFSQASKETQSIYGGTGLGLSITSKLVQRLGGTISVDSEVGKFAEFTVDLPFRGETVDVDDLKQKLSTTSIVLLQPEEQSASQELSHQTRECASFRSDVVREYDLNLQSCASYEEFDRKVTQASTIGRHYAVLVHEDLYVPQAFERFGAVVGPQNCTVITFGPSYKVAATTDRHLRTLSGLLPCVLLERLASRIALSRRQKLESSLSCPGLLSSAAPQKAIQEENVLRNADFKSLTETSTVQRVPRAASLSLAATNCLRGKQSVPARTGPQPKVLYAEDNLINQKVLARILQQVGVDDIDIVDNGQKAVEISAEKKYDIIFMDMQMPVMGGLEATRLIMERNRDAVVVFVTAHALDDFKREADAVGAKSFISKPFRKNDIEEVLKMYCPA